MKKKKILFFLPPRIGGAERVSITISHFLDNREFEVVFVVIGKNKGIISDYLPKEQRIIYIKIFNIWDFTTTKIYRLLKRELPDYTFSSNRYLNVRILLASHLKGGIKSIVRNDNGLKTVRWDNKFFMKFTYPWAHSIIAQQEEMRQELIDVMKFSSDKVITIHNPLDTALIDEKLKAQSPYEEGNTNIKYLWVGRFARSKGQDVLVKAFSIVHKKKPNTELYFVGRAAHPGYSDEVKKLVKEEHLQGLVHFVGYDDNPYKWMKYCDCFVLPSRYEGLPNSLIEAMYVGKPVVATRCIPVIDRIVEDGYNGYIIDPEDIDVMAIKMIEALSLKDFHMTYQPTPLSEFRKLFI